jgi:mono/diheme cytochrome c family protein
LRRLLLLGVLLGGTALALTGCAGETTESAGASLTTGKEMFVQSCGACHVMQAAGTQGQIGPNLDDAFGYSRMQDFEESTFFEVALGQMEIPVPPMPDFDEEGTKDFIPEEDRIAIAAFIAQCSYVSAENIPAECGAGDGGGGESTDGETIFNQNCASCHTLEAAGATGDIGPNLDDSQIALDAAIDQIANGSGAMPPFKDTLSQEQIEAVAKYVVENR